MPYGGLSYNCTYFYDIAQSVRDAMQGNTVNDYTDYCNTFTGEMHSAKFGTMCLLQMLLIAEIKSLLVNKKNPGKLLNMNVNVFNGLPFLLCAAYFCQGNMIITN